MTFTQAVASGGRRTELLQTHDFQGGLNLTADAFQLRGTESPDLLNVDLDPSGGFGLRRGVRLQNVEPLAGPPKNVWQYSRVAQPEQIMVQVGNDALFSTGAEFTAVGVSGTTNGRMRATVFADICYIQRNAEQSVVRWNGNTHTVLGTAFREPIDDPNDGNMPRAKCIAAHGGYVWVANTHEGGTNHPSRVRFSHPNKPENWRELDYIDIDVGFEGDEITGLASFGDRLLVFKRNAVHAIYGHDPETFGVQPIVQSVGAPSQEAIAVTQSEVYWFSWPEGVYRFDGRRVEWLFERIEPAITRNLIPGGGADGITVALLNHRLWVAVPWDASATNSRVLVFDPRLNQVRRGAQRTPRGGWTMYDIPLGPMFQWERRGDNQRFLGCHATEGYLLQLDNEHAEPFDTLESEEIESVWTPVERLIPSYYATRWFDADITPQVKRWKRPEFVLDAEKPVRLLIQSFRDYDPARIDRQFYVTVEQSNLDDVLGWVVDGLVAPWATAGEDPVLEDDRLTGGGATGVALLEAPDDGSFETDLFNRGAEGSVSIVVRAQSVSDNPDGYHVVIEPDGNVKIVQRDGGVDTVLEDAEEPDAVPFVGAVQVIADGDEITVLVNNEEVLSTTDSEFDEGPAGWGFRFEGESDAAFNSLTITDLGEIVTSDDFHGDDGSVDGRIPNNALGHNLDDEFGFWDESLWAADAAGIQDIRRGSNLGRGRAVQLRVIGPREEPAPWAVNNIGLKYVPRRLR